MRFNIFNEIDKENKKFFEKYIPATETDPACRTAAYQARIDKHRTWLLANPEQIEGVSKAKLIDIYANHRADLLEQLDLYLTELADAQAVEEMK